MIGFLYFDTRFILQIQLIYSLMVHLILRIWGHHPTRTWGRYVTGLAGRSVLSDWLRMRFATCSTSLMQFGIKHTKRDIITIFKNMKSPIQSLFGSISFLILLFSSLSIRSQSVHQIIPRPQVFTSHQGTSWSVLNPQIHIPAELANSYWRDTWTLKGWKISDDPSKTNVHFTPQSGLKAEGYTIQIDRDKINIQYKDKAGAHYAMVTLLQLLEQYGSKVPPLMIEDYPRFAYRGMHLDVCRHFFSTKEVKQYIDFLAKYKMNYFHWHLTEDQGWRIEIKQFPKLQEVAAYRKETLIGHYSDQPHQFDGMSYGGYYTQEEIKEIVEYATARNITIVPEIEMPGHALAALAAYPELGCSGGPYEVATKWGVFNDVFCPYEHTFEFLEKVVDEVIALFPGKYIHIGGDECPKTSWEESEFCQNLIKELGLEDMHALQSYFIRRMEQYINSKGKQIIGWDEILEGGLAPNATVMSWRGTEGGIEAANMSHQVIMTPGSHCYFDHYQSRDPDEPIAIGGFTTVEKVYHWDPIPKQLDSTKHQYILGGQANVWTEYIPDFKQVEYMAFSRGLAMSEVLWSGTGYYEEFLSRFDYHVDLLRSKGHKMAYHILDIHPDIDLTDEGYLNLSFKVPAGAAILMKTKDEYNWTVLKEDFVVLEKSGVYQFQAEKNQQKGKTYQLVFNKHLGTRAKLSLNVEPNSWYAGKGTQSLQNGVQGSPKIFKDGEWLGFSGENLQASFKFEESVDIRMITMRCFMRESDWIYPPKKVELSIHDGISPQVFSPQQILESALFREYVFIVDQNDIESLELNIENYGVIPPGAPGEGRKAWLFVDEIVIQ
jgi:hexosaminidase